MYPNYKHPKKMSIEEIKSLPVANCILLWRSSKSYRDSDEVIATLKLPFDLDVEFELVLDDIKLLRIEHHWQQLPEKNRPKTFKTHYQASVGIRQSGFGKGKVKAYRIDLILTSAGTSAYAFLSKKKIEYVEGIPALEEIFINRAAVSTMNQQEVIYG